MINRDEKYTELYKKCLYRFKNCLNISVVKQLKALSL